MKKRIAPILVTLIILGFLGAYVVGIIWAVNGLFGLARNIAFIYIGIVTVIAITLVVTLINRLKEIKEEENDDLSQY